ncbi:MAG: DUF5615 family PIN-like protein [Nostoc sp.]|uniref:DUF5615 family PIN-like protein n=1 Tax=Nostoc sp. TaxID=1180 RepID=UPI002FF67A94
MKLLLDQGLPLSAATLLRNAGIDTIHVGEIGMSEAEDAEIIQRAREERRVVARLDADFHTLLALDEATTPSVIRIRIVGSSFLWSSLSKVWMRYINKPYNICDSGE